MSSESPEFKPFETRLKVGQTVKVLRSNGEIEDDWTLHALEQVQEDGMTRNEAVLRKPSGLSGEALYKRDPIKDVEDWNS